MGSVLLAMIAFSGCMSPNLQIQSSVLSEDEPYNVILMIGDGMGFSHVELGRIIEYGNTRNFTMQQAPLHLDVITNNAHNRTTDSAAAATAMATGEKTYNLMLSVSPDGTQLETILEIAQARGKAAGLVATSMIQHATPAAFMTHIDNRNNYSEITRQIVEEAEVEVLMGGGLSYFSSQQLQVMNENQNYSLAYNLAELSEVTSGKLLGLFAEEHMDYEMDRNFSITPSIAEMTQKAIDLLSQDSDGFFLMVEGSKIDHAAHAHDKIRTALEAIAFDEAIAISLEYAQNHRNTILIVTADHETAGLSIVSNTLSDELPSSQADNEQKRNLRIGRASNVTVSWRTTGHTRANVPLFAFGEAFNEYSNDTIIDNTDIFSEMYQHYSSESDTLDIPYGFLVVGLGTALVVVALVFLSRRRNTM